MNTITSIPGPHCRTYEAIFHHPVAPEPAWRDVRALLDEISQVAEQPNGSLWVSRNGHTLILPTPRTAVPYVSAELAELRHSNITCAGGRGVAQFGESIASLACGGRQSHRAIDPKCRMSDQSRLDLGRTHQTKL